MSATGLREYNLKRDFSRTREPPGKAAARRSKGLRFVVQMHDASRLHYDFRLELDGVLKSWAIPKGPSLDPQEKRLAVQTEDHPITYGEFEGTIPEGEYGGGTVMLWDQGEWQPEGDARRDLSKGVLRFTLKGKRLQGGFVLTRLRKRNKGEKDNWLLIKRTDEVAEPASGDAVVAKAQTSVTSGRRLEEIASGNSVWRSNRAKPAQAPAPVASAVPRKPRAVQTRTRAALVAPAELDGARKAPIPDWIEPQLATLVDRTPPAEGYVSEIKFDGYRMLAGIDRGDVTIWSRNRKDWTAKLPSLREPLRKLACRQAILDGEIVVLDENSRSNFAHLKTALSGEGPERIVYYLFDLLYLDGYDLRRTPLLERKRALQGLLEQQVSPLLRYSTHSTGDLEKMREAACDMHLEGLIAKRFNDPYVSGRTRSWLKLKCVGREEFVILGYTDPAGSREGLGALHLGYYDGGGRLHYAGGVGTGFDTKTLRDLKRRLKAIERRIGPAVVSHGEGAPRRMHWVKPDLVAEVQYLGWTDDKVLRHCVYLGLRDDKAALDVRREPPQHDADRAEAAARSQTSIIAAAPPRKPAKTSVKAAARKKKALGGVVDLRRKGEGGVTLTHPERVFWDQAGVTKAALADYFRQVAAFMLPHVAGRPLALVRCPDGQSQECFYQKNASAGMPPAIKVGKAGKDHYFRIEDMDGLLAMAQVGALEIHPWGSRVETVETPDRITFDLDPDENLPFARVADAAKDVKKFLHELGLESYCKTTGGKGLHVVVPVKPRLSWDKIKTFAKGVAAEMVARNPDTYVDTVSKQRRKGRIFIDYLRNGRGATAVALLSPRARPGATVSMPLPWSRITSTLDPQKFSIPNLAEVLRILKANPWPDLDRNLQTIGPRVLKRFGVS